MRALMFGARALAIAIAIAALIDPSISSARRVKPDISLIAAGDTGGLVASVEKRLAGDYIVIRAPFPNAAATVIVGDALPENASELTSPVFAVAPPPRPVAIVGVTAPAAATIEARIPVLAALRVRGARRKTVEVALSFGGVMVDRVSRTAATDDDRLSIPLSFVPTRPGAVRLRVVARIPGAPDSAAADIAVEVRDRRWTVLFFDRRPSWMSTFVRRSLESDRRFVVASRVITSKNVSTDAGQPPSSLEDPALLELYDAIVVGAPEAMTRQDVAGLDLFSRRRGGGVVLLFDERPTRPGPYEQLLHVDRWAGATTPAPLGIDAVTGDSGGMRGTELMWPMTMPAGGEVVARSEGATGTAANRPVVWRSWDGVGQVIVSGALDAWRFRDRATSGFDQFWRSTMAGLANGALAPVEITLARPVVGEGEMIEVHATVRDAFLATPGRPAGTSVSAFLGNDADRLGVRLWPTAIGQFRGTFRAPKTSGEYRIRVVANGAAADVPVVVARGAADVSPDDENALAAWVGARKGQLFSFGHLEGLSAALKAVAQGQSRVEQWHPMRAAWWIAPFVFLLACEWVMRRRQGLA